MRRRNRDPDVHGRVADRCRGATDEGWSPAPQQSRLDGPVRPPRIVDVDDDAMERPAGEVGVHRYPTNPCEACPAARSREQDERGLEAIASSRRRMTLMIAPWRHVGSVRARGNPDCPGQLHPVPERCHNESDRRQHYTLYTGRFRAAGLTRSCHGSFQLPLAPTACSSFGRVALKHLSSETVAAARPPLSECERKRRMTSLLPRKAATTSRSSYRTLLGHRPVDARLSERPTSANGDAATRRTAPIGSSTSIASTPHRPTAEEPDHG